MGGKVVDTAVLPSILSELLSLLLRWRPAGSSDSGESKGGRSFLGCFFEELVRNNTDVNVPAVPGCKMFDNPCPFLMLGSPGRG